MGLLENFLSGAIGYGIAKSRDAIDEKNNRSRQQVSLDDLISEYAKRFEIYTQKNEFAHHLHKIAERYEEYNYEEVYGKR